MQIDPAANLRRHRERTKKSPIWNKLGSFFIGSLYFIAIICVIFLAKDFTILWFKVLMDTIKGNF